MKKLLLLLLLLSASVIAHSSLDNAKILFTDEEKEYINSNTLSIGMTKNNYPFSFQENGNISGFAKDYISLIMKKSGLKIVIQADNWTNTLRKFKNKEIDIIDSISYLKKREAFTSFTEPYFEVPNVLFSRKDEIDNYTGFESLKGKKVGITKDIYYYNTIKSMNILDLVEFKSSKDKIEALAYEQVDVVFNNLINGQRLIKTAGYANIEILDIVDSSIIKREDLRLGIRKENTLLFSIINKTISSITRSEKEILYNKWFAAKLISKETNNKVALSVEETSYLKEKKQINMCIDPNWMPFEKLDEKGKYIGMSSDYYKIFKEMLNINIEIIPTNTWAESLQNVKERKCDILSLAMETKNRKEYLNFTNPYLKMPIVLATQVDVPFIDNFHTLKNRKVGIPKGYAIIEIFKEKYPNLDIVEVDGIQEGLMLVDTGELFGYIGTLASITYQFQQGLAVDLKITGMFTEKWNLGIGVRNDDNILFNILNKTIDNVHPQIHQQILNSWISIKYEKGINYKIIWQIAIIVVFIALFFLYRQYMLQKSINSLDQVLNSTIDAIAIFKNHKLKQANQVFLDMYDYSSLKEIQGKNILSFIDKSQHSYLKSQLNNTLPYEINMLKKDNSIFPALVRDTEVTNHLRVTSVLDLSELKKKDKILQEQSKLAAMGEIIGNIAHQWRQPLSVISTAATGMQVQKEYGILEDKIFYKTCEDINKNAQYLSKTIDDFRNFIKGDRKKNSFFLYQNINSFLHLIDAPLKGNNITVIQNIDENIFIKGYENELIQCFMNICNNAKDALKEVEGKRYIFIKAYRENKKIFIEIQDNAGGIEEDVSDHIYEPYFTTKNKSQGTGLGLHMAYKIIVEGMNGEISSKNVEYKYENKDYKGARFTIALPLS